jgi:hypothetical protein
MSISISAPYPKAKVTTILPDPQLGNSRTPESNVQLKRSMTGRLWSYVQSNANEILSMTFVITRQKDFELAEFIRVYLTADWELIDHNGKKWKVKLLGDPIRRESIGRAAASNANATGGETKRVTLTFSAEAL